MPPRSTPKKNTQGYYRTTVKMPDGSRREIRAKTEREYKDKLLEAEIERKQWTAKAERVLLKDFALQWLEQIAMPELRNNTIKNHKGRIDKWIVPHLGSKTIASITTENVDGFLHALRKVEWRPGYHLTNRTIYNIFTTLNFILDQAVTWKRIPANPCDHAQRLKLNAVQQLVPRRRRPGRCGAYSRGTSTSVPCDSSSSPAFAAGSWPVCSGRTTTNRTPSSAFAATSSTSKGKA